uniref:alpha-1,6-mannosyl-glycoprotein 6-beta-N-acetylglucosaminyltransferase n=1 Tax=Kwoniella dejecticola CBS 10117 TaxID=1296121 RepID=A0A1A6A9X5_9TREE|nr:uncharacterized protein I303_02872 [Kwoniella dejecticola CBS 10117]OBR86853.1 hypothetical protein I303_02872 [Kwoniella dejecticola CBS 10117]
MIGLPRRIVALIITFITTLLTLSVFFYLSITPSAEFEYQDAEFSINRYTDESSLHGLWGLKRPHLQLEGWKEWIGLSRPRDRAKEARDIRDLSDLFYERFPLDDKRAARGMNRPALERLAHCIETNTCGRDEEKVVLLASFHFNNAITGGTSGEDIWARSTLEALHSLNYTLLYSFGPMDTLTLYQGLQDKVKTIIWEGAELKKCLARNETNWESLENDHTPGTFQNQTAQPRFGCFRRPGFEEGIPPEKSFTFHFWSGPENPLGGEFTLSPEDYKSWNKGVGNHYLGYSLETRCKAIPLPTHKEHRGMALGKYAKYFNTSSRDWVWGKEDILRQAILDMPHSNKGEKFEMIATGGHDDGRTGAHELMYKGIRNMGGLPQDEWYQTVAASKFLLGVGRPLMSPSPYDALCLGVPFINPITWWNREEPEDWSRWITQHDALRPYGPPYVYHVQKENHEQLEEAMKAAMDNPIDRFIPPPMTVKAVRERHRKLVETDWTPSAKAAVRALWTDKGKEFPYLLH